MANIYPIFWGITSIYQSRSAGREPRSSLIHIHHKRSRLKNPPAGRQRYYAHFLVSGAVGGAHVKRAAENTIPPLLAPEGRSGCSPSGAKRLVIVDDWYVLICRSPYVTFLAGGEMATNSIQEPPLVGRGMLTRRASEGVYA